MLCYKIIPIIALHLGRNTVSFAKGQGSRLMEMKSFAVPKLYILSYRDGQTVFMTWESFSYEFSSRVKCIIIGRCFVDNLMLDKNFGVHTALAISKNNELSRTWSQ